MELDHIAVASAAAAVASVGLLAAAAGVAPAGVARPRRAVSCLMPTATSRLHKAAINAAFGHQPVLTSLVTAPDAVAAAAAVCTSIIATV